MKTFTLTIILFLISLTSFAQDTKEFITNDSVFIDQSHLETIDSVLLPQKYEYYIIKTIINNFQYSDLLYENAIMGSVVLKCNISSDGSLSSIEIEKSPSDQLSEEAINTLKSFGNDPRPTGLKKLITLRLKFNYGVASINYRQFKNGSFEIFKYIPARLVGKQKTK